MKRMIFVVILLALALSACSGGEVYKNAYTASGDGTNEIDLSKTKQFQKNADLNVVVKLNSHDSDVEVEATFIDPAGQQVGDTLKVTAAENVGTVVLGLDWEANPNQELWNDGAWRVEIRIDGKEVETLDFAVG